MTTRQNAIFLALSLGLASAAACSSDGEGVGATDTDGGGSGGSSGKGSGGTSGSSGGTGGTGDGSAGESSGGTGGSAGGDGSATGGSAGASTGGSAGAATGGAAGAGTAGAATGGTSGGGGIGGQTPNSIDCETSSCGAPDNRCCVQTGFPLMTSCMMSFPGCITGGISVACDDPGDCPNQEVCCGTRGAGTDVIAIGCAPACTGANEVRICRRDQDCASGDVCRPLTGLLDEYGACE
jgi:hypothetical protein